MGHRGVWNSKSKHFITTSGLFLPSDHPYRALLGVTMCLDLSASLGDERDGGPGRRDEQAEESDGTYHGAGDSARGVTGSIA
jgi:hypothetical protein